MVLSEQDASTGVGPSPDRRAELVRTAAAVFLRFGFRKTSMDDIARAAKLSRQGLYLHFPNKELLFREAIAHLAGLAVDALRTALLRLDLDLEDRLLEAFEAMSASALAGHDPANVKELFASAGEIAGDVLARIDDEILTELARALTPARKGRSRANPSPRALAEHLYTFSYGAQQRGYTGQDYRTRMETAIRIVCNSARA